MKSSYPRHKLKVVSYTSNDNDVTLEIEKVINSRMINGEQQYLVKWKNNDEEDWIPISNFNSIEPITSYNQFKALESENIMQDKQKEAVEFEISNAKKHECSTMDKKTYSRDPIENEQLKQVIQARHKRPRGRPPKLVTVASILTLMFMYFFKISSLGAIEIKDNFVFCDPFDRKMVDIDNSCQLDGSESQIDMEERSEIINLARSGKAYIFENTKHLVSGKAHECSITKSIITTYKSFFGTESITKFDEIKMVVTKQVCDDMIKLKTCENLPMTCIDSICYSDNIINKSYEWLTYKQHEVINCKLVTRFVLADSYSESLFDMKGCKPGDGECTLSNSYIIWDSNIIHTCPVNYITTINISDVYVLNKNKTGYSGGILSTVISKDSGMVFHLTEKETLKNCENIVFYKTNQGLKLTFDENSIKLPKLEEEVFDINKLILADSDMSRWIQFEESRHLAYEICTTMENLVRVSSVINNRFFKIKSTKKEEIIFFAMDGKVFLPKCHKLSNLTIKTRQLKSVENYCPIDLPISYTYLNKNFDGFLDLNQIITPVQNLYCQIPCGFVIQKFYFDSSANIIIRNGTEYQQVYNTEKNNAISIDFGDVNVFKLNFRHSQMIKNSVDFIKEFKSLSSSFENNLKIFHGKEDFVVSSETGVGLILKKVVNWFYDIFMSLKWFILVFSITIIIGIIIFLLWKTQALQYCHTAIRSFITYLSQVFSRRRISTNNNINNNETIEMVEMYKNNPDPSTEIINESDNKHNHRNSESSFDSKSIQTDKETTVELKNKFTTYKKLNNDIETIQPSKLNVEYSSINTHKYYNDEADLFHDQNGSATK